MAFLILANPVLAENRSLRLMLDVNTSMDITGYSLTMMQAQVIEGQEYDPWDPNQMNIDMLDQTQSSIFSTGFTPEFLLLSDPPMELNETVVILILPYSTDAKYLKVYHYGIEKISIDLQKELCTRNGKCDNSENYYSCPQDCSICAKDGVCASLSYDGCCDPDCPASLDLDCSCPNRTCEEWENYKTCPKDCPSGGKDGYCDGLKDGRCDSDCNRREDIDCSCPNNRCELFETHGTCPQDCPPEYQVAIYDFIGGYWTHILLGGIGACVVVFLFLKWRKL